MSGGKKILRIFLFLALFVPAYLAVYNIYIISSDKFTVENITKIEILASVEGPLLAEYTNNADIRNYIRTIENANPINASRELIYEQPLIVKFYKGERQYAYGLYLSLNPNDCVIKTSDGELFHMREADAERILRTELSDTLYAFNRIPAAAVFYGEESAEIFPSEGEWMLKKADGEFYPSTIANITISESNSARAFQNRPFDIRFAAVPDIILIEVTDGKEIVFNGILSNFNENFYRDEMRDLKYTITAEWQRKEENDFYGNAKYLLDIKYFVPAKFEISHAEASAGDIAAVTAYNISGDENLTLTTDIGYETSFYSVGTNKIALIPIGLGEDFAGRTFNLTLTSSVNEPIDYYLQINGKEQKTWNMGAQDSFIETHLSASALDTRKSRYNDITAVASEPGQNQWTDKFVMPAEGRLLLEYGWRVTVNTGHPQINNGVNIEIPVDQPVKASNGGRVIFAGEVPYDGNLVVIDHGAGIKTWYGHLGKIDVKAGDGVLKGQQIGLSGRSGIITNLFSGGHLFFGMSVGNVFVDPANIIANGIPGIDSVTSDGYDYNDIPGLFDGDNNGESGSNGEDGEPEAAGSVDS
ncbi:MAG: M23 family metallopeptidase [Oscillospiraceae bacterium]|nr:M23 family metallopeptidase [Oscillospiraceae bacterium]